TLQPGSRRTCTNTSRQGCKPMQPVALRACSGTRHRAASAVGPNSVELDFDVRHLPLRWALRACKYRVVETAGKMLGVLEDEVVDLLGECDERSLVHARKIERQSIVGHGCGR